MAKKATKRAWPAATVVMWDIGRLTPDERNARKHSAEQIEQLRGSLRQFGFAMPILARPNGVVIAGHGRLQAAQAEGFTEAPVIVATGWSDEQCRAYMIADNALTDASEWDEDLLRIELADLQGGGFDIGSLGIDTRDLDRLLHSEASGDVDPDEDADALPTDPVSRRGDVWRLGEHRLCCGDATSAADVGAVLVGKRPHLMVTDPPYGVEYDPSWRAAAGVNRNKKKLGKVSNDDRSDWREAWALFPGDVAYVWHAGRHAGSVQASIEAAGFAIRSQIIWAKDRMVLSRGDYHWRHEPCFYAVREKKTGHWHGDRSQTTLWEIAARDDGGHGHGTQKPVECMKRPILNNSKPGDLVYEPFSGSGTTIIAAEITGRKCLAVELDPSYVDVAIARWEKFTGEGIARLDSDGRSFADVAAERKAKAA